jgi:hypothetical protein
MKKIGITGTRNGMTEPQRGALVFILRFNWMKEGESFEFHHGLCVGVDCESHEMVDVNFPSWTIVGHPPVKTEQMGNVACDVLRESKNHFARNRDIVDETEVLIVVPYQDEWQPRGGTWYTHDYAIKRGKPVVIVWPDGQVTQK